MTATPTPPAVPSSASVVVIGGGIMGVSTAYHLAQAGVEDVVLLERDTLGSGSTCKAAGGVRASFSDEANILLGARSLETYRRFPTLFDQDIDLVTSGYLFLLDREEDAAVFESSVELQRSLGVRSEMVTPARIADLSPLVRTEDLVAGAWGPDDGHATPESAVAGFARAARRLGVRILQHTAVTSIVVEDGRITGVETNAGPIATGTVVCTAGAWSGALGAMVGVDLPVTPLRRHIMVTAPVSFDARSMPFTLDVSTSFYFHSEGSGMLLGAPDRTDAWGFDMHQDPRWSEYLCELIEHRAPGLADVQAHRGWAGLYEVTPDHNALIGRAHEVEGFLYACGFSGHGFLQGPAVGEVLRDLHLGTTPVVDVSGLSADRFAAESLRPEAYII